MASDPCIDISHVSYRYGQRRALNDLELQIAAGEIFALLGPNGGGKTTLFRLISTLIPLQEGSIRVLGLDIATQADEVRRLLGVVFQAPSLDKKLSVRENLQHQGHLYGLSGRDLADRCDEMLRRLGLADRAGERVEKLSGGMRRRVELAKGMLHRPAVLLLDEPSTGLDPGARSDLWTYLRQLREQDGVTVLLTTHLLEEAERVDRLAIVHQGSLVALDSPERLQASVGGDSITIEAADPAELAQSIAERFQVTPRMLDGSLRLEAQEGHQLLARLVDAYPGRIRSITLGKPTLEDVFIQRTGHKFWQSTEEGDQS